MLPDKIQTIENAAILPVETFYDLAVDKLIATHEQLDQLPKNPYGDDTPGLTAMKQELGIADGNDFGMFVSGGIEQAALGALTGAFGIAAGGAVDMAIDVGTSMVTEADNDNKTRSSSSVSKDKYARRPAFKRASQNAGTKTLLQKAKMEKQYKAYKQAEKRRRMLMRQLEDLKEKINLLTVYKKQGITHVKMSADGKELTPLNGQPRFVLKADNDRYQDKMAFQAKFSAPAPRMAA